MTALAENLNLLLLSVGCANFIMFKPTIFSDLENEEIKVWSSFGEAKLPEKTISPSFTSKLSKVIPVGSKDKNSDRSLLDKKWLKRLFLTSLILFWVVRKF